MEDEAENLRKIQEQTIEEQLNGGEGAGEGEGAASEEVDSRSVYIGQVRRAAKSHRRSHTHRAHERVGAAPELHFQLCGSRRTTRVS